MDARELNFIGSCTLAGEVHIPPQKNNQSGVGSGMDNLGQWGLGLGDAGFGVLSPCNYGSQEEADEGADEKTDYEGNHFSFSFSK